MNVNDVPMHLRLPWNPAEALVQQPSTDWAKACAEAARRAIEDPDARHLREFGVRTARKPGYLPERGIGDQEGREALMALALRQRGGR